VPSVLSVVHSVLAKNLQVTAPLRLGKSRDGKAALGMLQHGLYLLSGHTGKPLDKVIDPRPALEILEEGLHGHACTFEQPGATHFTGNALNSGTVAPIEHGSKIRPCHRAGKGWFAARRPDRGWDRHCRDGCVLAPTRWRLRQAVRVLNQELAALKLDKHSDKTFIGRSERGFDFIGYHFSPTGLTVAAPMMARFVARASFMSESGEGAKQGRKPFRHPLRLERTCNVGATTNRCSAARLIHNPITQSRR